MHAYLTSEDLPEFIALANKHIQDIQVVFDVGAYDGGDSMQLVRAWPKARVYAFEGLTRTYNTHLKDNRHITAVNTVVTDHDGTTKFYEKNGIGIHSIFKSNDLYKGRRNKYDHVLPCTRLDTYCRANDIARIDVMKLDVEGAAYEVFQGMGAMLTKVGIMHVETENKPVFGTQHLDAEITDLLTKAGFKELTRKRRHCMTDIYQYDTVWLNSRLA